MPEGQKQFLSPAGKQRNFFAEHGQLTPKERALSRFLSAYVKKRRISSSSFVGGLAGETNILNDEKMVKELKVKFEKNHETLPSSIREAIERGALSEQAILYGMQTGEWLGDGSKVRIASEYDDFINGVDCIVELDSTKQLAIGIDTTISEKKIVEKLQGIRDQILRGRLTEVRYFKNENFTGTLHNVPLTVVGVNFDANSSLASLVYDIETTDPSYLPEKPDKKDKAQREIKNHTIQFTMLFEIRMQLETFLSFAIKIGANGEIITKLENDLEKIKEVIKAKAPKDKMERERLIDEIKKDGVFIRIKRALKDEFTEWKEQDVLIAQIK